VPHHKLWRHHRNNEPLRSSPVQHAGQFPTRESDRSARIRAYLSRESPIASLALRPRLGTIERFCDGKHVVSCPDIPCRPNTSPPFKIELTASANPDQRDQQGCKHRPQRVWCEGTPRPRERHRRAICPAYLTANTRASTARTSGNNRYFVSQRSFAQGASPSARSRRLGFRSSPRCRRHTAGPQRGGVLPERRVGPPYRSSRPADGPPDGLQPIGQIVL